MSLNNFPVLVQTSFVLDFCFEWLAEVLTVLLVHADALSALMVEKSAPKKDKKEFGGYN